MRKDADDRGAAVELAMDAFQVVRGAQPARVGGREGEHGQTFGDVLFQPISQLGCAPGVLLDGPSQVGVGSWAIRRIENHADIGRHFRLQLLARYVRLGVLLQVILAAP